MSSLVLLAAAPDAIAPISASVLALLAFLVIIPVVIHDGGSSGRTKVPQDTVLADSDQPLEDQVGA